MQTPPPLMHAVLIRRFGGPEVVEYADLPVPEPGPGELLLKVEAASLNPVDWKIRSGKYPVVQEDKLPFVLGRDFSATVVQSVDPRRHHELAGRVGIEGQRTDRDRSGAGEPDRVVGVDRGERRCGIGGCETSHDARRHETGAVVEPREPVGIEAVQGVVGRLDRARHCPQAGGCGRGGHARVPVISSTEPPVSVVWRTSRNPAARRWSSSSGIGGR